MRLGSGLALELCFRLAVCQFRGSRVKVKLIQLLIMEKKNQFFIQLYFIKLKALFQCLYSNGQTEMLNQVFSN